MCHLGRVRQAPRTTHRVVGAGALALGLVFALAAAPAGAQAKKAAKTKVFQASTVVNAAIPDAVAMARSVPLVSTITVPKKYKGKVVGDVNVVGLQTTGVGEFAARDLIATLIAPDGRALLLFRQLGTTSLGPWTLDDDTRVSTCDQPAPNPCTNPLQSLNQPFAGTSNLNYNDISSLPLLPLQSMDGARMRGVWTLSVADLQPESGTSTLNAWGLRIVRAKRVGR